MWKVGVCLIYRYKKEIIQRVIENSGGIAKTSDFVDKGISKCEVAAFCKDGAIDRKVLNTPEQLQTVINTIILL